MIAFSVGERQGAASSRRLAELGLRPGSRAGSICRAIASN